MIGDDKTVATTEETWSWERLAFDWPPFLVLYTYIETADAADLDVLFGFHLAQGVDLILVALPGAADDETRAALHEWAGTGRLAVLEDAAADELTVLTPEVAHWVWCWRTEWVLTAAPDELWLPRIGTIRALFSALPVSVGAVYGVRGVPLEPRLGQRPSGTGFPLVWPLVDVMQTDTKDERLAKTLNELSTSGALSAPYWRQLDKQTSQSRVMQSTPSDEALLSYEIEQAQHVGAEAEPLAGFWHPREPITSSGSPPAKSRNRLRFRRSRRGVDRLDGIYAINLASRPDRLKSFRAEMNRLRCSFNRVEGVPHRSGHVGCNLGHAAAVAMLIARDADAGMICEDDASFVVGRDIVDELVDEFLDDAATEVACLAFNALVTHPYSELFERTTHTEVMCCYLLKRSIAPKLLRLLEAGAAAMERGEPTTVWISDQVWKRLQSEHVFLVPRERAVIQRPSYSDVERREVAEGFWTSSV